MSHRKVEEEVVEEEGFQPVPLDSHLQSHPHPHSRSYLHREKEIKKGSSYFTTQHENPPFLAPEVKKKDGEEVSPRHDLLFGSMPPTPQDPAAGDDFPGTTVFLLGIWPLLALVIHSGDDGAGRRRWWWW
jgi:hypothetical protein